MIDKGKSDFKALMETVNPNNECIEVYRAADDDYGGPQSIWAEDKEDAKKYLVNPGFGGKYLHSGSLCGKFYDGDNPEEDILSVFIKEMEMEEDNGIYPQDIAKFIEDIGDRKWPYGLWEEVPEIAETLKDEEYSAIRYTDDFPEGAISYHVLTDVHDIDRISDVKDTLISDWDNLVSEEIQEGLFRLGLDSLEDYPWVRDISYLDWDDIEDIDKSKILQLEVD